jgi:hypothetical protein
MGGTFQPLNIPKGCSKAGGQATAREYDQGTGEVHLLPTGVGYVEENLPLEF